MAPRIELFAFRYRLPGQRIRARYLATREEIAKRYAEWEILGPCSYALGVKSSGPNI